MKSWRKLLPIIALLFMVSCSTHVPRGVIKPDKYAWILKDIHQLDAMRTLEYIQTPDQLLDDQYQMIFEKYGVTKAEFDSSLSWYWHHQKELLIVYDSVKARAERDARKIEEESSVKANKGTNAGDAGFRHKPKR